MHREIQSLTQALECHHILSENAVIYFHQVQRLGHVVSTFPWQSLQAGIIRMFFGCMFFLEQQQI